MAAPAFATDCRDVRTGRAFTVPAARYTAEGVVVPDSALLGRLCVGALRSTYAVPIGDGAGGACVVWIESAGEDCDLRVQHVGPTGDPAAGWPDGGRVLCAARGTQTQPVIANASEGGLWLAWKDYRDSQRSAVYLARLDAQGVPLAGFPADGLRVSGEAESASDPALVADGAGGGSGAFLIWQQGRTGVRRLLLSHYDDGGALTAGWPAEGRVLVDSLQNAVRPIATRDPAGGFTLAWVAESPGSSHLRLARFGAFGTPAAGWPADGLEITGSAAHLQPLALAADTGGVYLTWSEASDDSSRALLTHVMLTGAVYPGWPSGGRVIGIAGSTATSPALALDGAGGAYLAWADHTGESGAGDIRLERLAPGGESAAGWSADGVAVTSTATDESQPRLLALADGVLVSWSDGEGEGHGQGVILSAAMASLGALPELGSIEKWPDLVRLSWRAEGATRYGVAVERRGDDGVWLPLKELERDAGGAYVLDDHEVVAGEALTYRLRLRSPQLEVVTGEVRVDVPASTPLAIRGLAVQGGVLHLACSLPVRGESRFELFDVQGRRLLRDVRQNEHGGEITLAWPVPDGVRAGVFFARLTQSGTSRTRRFVLAGR
jgi:hypothetical protein